MTDVSTIEWRKSSHSGSNGGDCVELAGGQDLVAVRDSKNRDGVVLTFGREAFRVFAAEVKGRG